MAFKSLVGLFCCPPCPNSIVSRVAFWPPQPTYRLVPVQNAKLQHIVFHVSSTWSGKVAKSRLEAFAIATSRGSEIACVFLRCTQTPRYTLLYSHENATDLGLILEDLFRLGEQIDCNVFCYDYSGYGASSGSPSERNMYADVEAAWRVLHRFYKLPATSVLLYGASIGTAAAIHLATRHEFAGLVLQSGIMSGLRVVFKNAEFLSHFCDPFPNIDRVDRIGCPVLVVHGVDDEIVSIEHGYSIYEKCPNTVEPLWLSGVGHNDVRLHDEYMERMLRFVTYELHWHKNGKNEPPDESSYSEHTNFQY